MEYPRHTEPPQPQWEKVADCTYRLPVVGGWLYRYNGADNTCMVFVPAPPQMLTETTTTSGLPTWKDLTKPYW